MHIIYIPKRKVQGVQQCARSMQPADAFSGEELLPASRMTRQSVPLPFLFSARSGGKGMISNVLRGLSCVVVELGSEHHKGNEERRGLHGAQCCVHLAYICTATLV